jgi:hypothetical protein
VEPNRVKARGKVPLFQRVNGRNLKRPPLGRPLLDRAARL